MQYYETLRKSSTSSVQKPNKCTCQPDPDCPLHGQTREPQPHQHHYGKGYTSLTTGHPTTLTRICLDINCPDPNRGRLVESI